jgi:hypothetical protein
MRIDPRSLPAPALAALVLVLVVQQTVSALRGSGAWRGGSRIPATKTIDPYATLDAILARPLLAYSPQGKRDPFGYAPAPTPVATRPTPPRQGPAPPPATAPPVLTSIIWDADPRATIRFNNRDFSVRENTLFADFRVRSITNSQVILERNDGEPLVLTLRPKGD